MTQTLTGFEYDYKYFKLTTLLSNNNYYLYKKKISKVSVNSHENYKMQFIVIYKLK